MVVVHKGYVIGNNIKNQKKYTLLKITEMANTRTICFISCIHCRYSFGRLLYKKSEETPNKPQFTFDTDAKKTINSQEDAEVESYMIEYAEGDDSEKSKLIDLTLSWKNGQGFDSVNKVILNRIIKKLKMRI